MKITVILTFVLCSGWIAAQSNFYRQYSSNGYDFGEGIVGLPDSGYVITGASSSFMDGPSQMFLLKIDSLGNFLWSKHFGGAETDRGRRIKHIEDDGFFVGGYTNSFGNGSYDFALWKIDENGNEEWFKTYGTSGWERVHDMAVTADSGVILVGETNQTNDGFTDIYIVRTDYDGNVVWEKQIENQGNDNALSISQFDDSTFVISGYYYNSSTNLTQALLMRIQDNGTELWTQIWGDNFNYDITDTEIYNNVIVGVGRKAVPDTDEEYLYISKTDGVNGNVFIEVSQINTPERAVGITTHSALNSYVICTSNMGQYSFGVEDLFFFGFDDGIHYYNTLGAVQYATTQILGEVMTTYNYGSIAVGSNEGIGPGGSSLFILRIGTEQPYISSDNDFSSTSLVSLKTVEKTNSITVFPNPAKEKLYIKADEIIDDYDIAIFDLLGKEVLKYNINQLNQTTVDISPLSRGVYIFVIRNEHGEVLLNQKIEVE